MRLYTWGDPAFDSCPSFPVPLKISQLANDFRAEVVSVLVYLFGFLSSLQFGPGISLLSCQFLVAFKIWKVVYPPLSVFTKEGVGPTPACSYGTKEIRFSSHSGVWSLHLDLLSPGAATHLLWVAVQVTTECQVLFHSHTGPMSRAESPLAGGHHVGQHS